MLIKIIAIVVFVGIVASLGSALFFLVKGKDRAQSQKTANALTLRIGLSLLLFLLLAAALLAGKFQPTGIGARIQQLHQAPAGESAKP